MKQAWVNDGAQFMAGLPADTRGFRRKGGETCTALSSCGVIKNLTAKKQIQWRRSGDWMLSLESIDEE